MSEPISDYERYRGKCKELSEAAVTADPSLRLVRGHYYDFSWGKQVEFDGICSCEECGKEVREEDAYMAGPYPCCSDTCALRLVGL